MRAARALDAVVQRVTRHVTLTHPHALDAHSVARSVARRSLALSRALCRIVPRCVKVWQNEPAGDPPRKAFAGDSLSPVQEHEEVLGEDDGTVYLVDVELQVVATCVAVEAVGFSRGFWASISERDARRFNDSPHRIILLSSTVALAELADRRNGGVMQPRRGSS